MYSVESFKKVLVPKYYKSRDALIEDAFRALLNLIKGLIVKGIAMKEEILKMVGDIEISDNRVLEVEL